MKMLDHIYFALFMVLFVVATLSDLLLGHLPISFTSRLYSQYRPLQTFVFIRHFTPLL
jgi:hypothetical protein